jgi:hypothetical protein
MQLGARDNGHTLWLKTDTAFCSGVAEARLAIEYICIGFQSRIRLQRQLQMSVQQ